MGFITPIPQQHHRSNNHLPIPKATTPLPSSETQPPTPDPFTTTYKTLQNGINKTFNTIYTPFPNLLPPLTRPFHKSSSNFILHPTEPPKAVLHFLGAAFFGAAPHILYHTLLTKLSNLGYVIVATPYNLSFDYLPLTERICRDWEAVETDLAARYGPLPVIGVGHSAGALFHSLSSCLFEDLSPRAGHAFVSFNNRDAADAIPGYEALVAPLSTALARLKRGVPDDVIDALEDLPRELDQWISGPLAPNKFVEEVLPTLKEANKFFEQLPALVEEMGHDGVREFYPCREDVESALGGLYPVEHTLVIKFENDLLDDSMVLVNAIRKRGYDVSLVELRGTHLTPLVQEPDIGGVGGLMAELVGGVGIGQLEGLVKVIDEWVDSGIANDIL